MTISLTKPSANTIGWAAAINQNFTDIEASVNSAGDPAICHGRLTASSTNAVTTSDTTSPTLYLLPRQNAGFTNSGAGSKVALHSGTAWALHDIGVSGVSGSVTSLTTTTTAVYDVFLYDNAGTLTLEFVKWASNTARASALVIQDGVLVKTGATSRRYVGTIRVVDNAGTISVRDSSAQRFIWNMCNRVPRVLKVTEASNSWTYTLATYRQANASTSNQVEVVLGIGEDPVDIGVHAHATSSSGTKHVSVGVGVDSTSVNSADVFGAGISSGMYFQVRAFYSGVPSIGYHYFAWLEWSQAVGTTTWTGDAAGADSFQAGMLGKVLA